FAGADRVRGVLIHYQSHGFAIHVGSDSDSVLGDMWCGLRLSRTDELQDGSGHVVVDAEWSDGNVRFPLSVGGPRARWATVAGHWIDWDCLEKVRGSPTPNFPLACCGLRSLTSMISLI